MMKATIIALILGCILTCVISAPATTHAFVITLDPENTMISEPANGMVLRSFVDPPDERLGQAALQLTYEPDDMRHLFNLVSITVAKGPVTVGIQYADGTIGVYNDLTAGVWPLEGGDRVDRVTLECPSGALCPSAEVLLTMVRVMSLEIEPFPTPYYAVGIGAPGGTVIIDGFTQPPTWFYPDGWCFTGFEAELRFSSETVALSRVTYGFPLVCTPGKGGGAAMVPGRGGGSGGVGGGNARANFTQVKQKTPMLLDRLAKPGLEASMRIYSIDQTVTHTEPRSSAPPAPYVTRAATPPGALDWGGAHTHPTDSPVEEWYDPQTGRGSIGTDIETTIRFWKDAGMNGETNWVRLNQGETIVIDPNSRMIFQVRPPTKPGAKAVFRNPLPIPAELFN